MDVTPLIRKDAQVIQSYKGGRFAISGQSFEVPVVVTIQTTRPWDNAPSSVQGLEVSHFETVMAEHPETEVLLFGTGATFTMIPASFRRAFKERYGIAIEVMDTGAASRTFNVLMAEGRNVMAVMLAG